MASGAIGKRKQICFLKEAGVDPTVLKTDQKTVVKLLHDGVDYQDKKKRFWVVNNRDCFAIYARGLTIDNGDRSEYWQWTTDGSGTGTELAEVTKARWLGVRGSFETENLTQNAAYTVLFKLKTTRSSTMAKQMVNLKLTFPDGTPDGTKQERQEMLPEGSDGTWHELVVGQFYMKPQNIGVMTFAMQQQFDDWKSGLIIWRVEIKAE